VERVSAAERSGRVYEADGRRDAVGVEGGPLMAPARKVVDGRAAAKLVRPTLEDKARAKVAADRATRLEANRRHVAATGKPMPQGGAHRRGKRA